MKDFNTMSPSESLVLNTFCGDSFVMVNKVFLKYFNGDGSLAIFLSELITSYKYHLNGNLLDFDNSFPIPSARYQIVLGLSVNKQKRILDKLQDQQIINYYFKGFPSSRYLKINFNKILTILESQNVKEANKKENSKIYYSKINDFLHQKFISYTQGIDDYGTILVDLEKRDIFQNMMKPLRDSLIVISFLLYRTSKELTKDRVIWSPEILGKLRHWLNKKTYNKPFDFNSYTVLYNNFTNNRDNNEATLKDSYNLQNFVNFIVNKNNSIPDAHYSDQQNTLEDYFRNFKNSSNDIKIRVIS